VQIRADNSTTWPANVTFDLDNGTVDTQTQGTGTIQEVGNGWYRCAVTATASASANTNFNIFLLDDSKSSTFTGTGAETLIVWGAQVEVGATPSSFIPSDDGVSTVTRAAETFTIPSAKLPWPTPQYIGDELVTNGDFSNGKTGFTESGDGSGSVSNEEFTIVRGATADQTLNQAVTTVVGRVYEFSVNVSANTVGKFRLVAPNADTGYLDIGTTGKISLPFVASSTSSSVRLQQGGSESSTTTFDDFSVREINPLSVSIQMDGRYTVANENDLVMFARWYKDIDNRIQLYRESANWFFYQRALGVTDTLPISSSDDYGVLYSYDLAQRSGSTFINGAVEGVSGTANTTPTALPDLSSTDLSLAYTYMGTIKTFRIWDKDLTDTGIAEATAPSLEPSLSLSFDSTESSFVDKGWSE